MAAHRLKLGRYFGIELFVHWSFGLLVAYVAFSTYSTGGSPAMIGFSVAQLLAVFLCVTLHEYGHSLAARSYGVDTVDITLLPIGGVARLKRIPRVPVQEFVIAIAGPAVNVAIAALLALGLAVAMGFKGLGLLGQSSVGLAFSETDEEMDRFIGETFMEPSLLGFAISLLVINLLLVIFNLIPAFPMDGGRVFRSLLAMALPYANATRWAQRIGVVCAALMAAFAISSDPPRLVMLAIAAFIVYAGQMEARQVDLTERLDQLTVGDVMTRKAPEVPMNWNLVQLQQWWQEQTTATVAVTGIGNILVGTLSVSDLAKAYEALEAKGHDPLMLTAGEIADHDADGVHPSALLEAVVGSSQRYRQVPVVDSQYRLIGWLDFDTLFARASLSRFAKQSPQLQATAPAEADAAQPANYLF